MPPGVEVGGDVEEQRHEGADVLHGDGLRRAVSEGLRPRVEGERRQEDRHRRQDVISGASSSWCSSTVARSWEARSRASRKRASTVSCSVWARPRALPLPRGQEQHRGRPWLRARDPPGQRELSQRTGGQQCRRRDPEGRWGRPWSSVGEDGALGAEEKKEQVINLGSDYHESN